MQYLISYDISDTKIRNKVVKYLESFKARYYFNCQVYCLLNDNHTLRVIDGIYALAYN